MVSTKDPPRLTTALRAFANISIRYEPLSPAEYKELLAKKKRQRAERLAEAENLQWRKLSEVMRSCAKNVKPQEVGGMLRELLQVSKLVGK